MLGPNSVPVLFRDLDPRSHRLRATRFITVRASAAFGKPSCGAFALGQSVTSKTSEPPWHWRPCQSKRNIAAFDALSTGFRCQAF